MCGRFSCSSLSIEKELIELGVQFAPNLFKPRFNISPTQNHHIVLKYQHQLHLYPATWGISPPWLKDSKVLFNAKYETVLEKKSFQSAFGSHRCLIPVDGFYEWKKEGGKNQPYWIHQEQLSLFYLGGFCFVKENNVYFVILTVPAQSSVKSVHDRQPLIIPNHYAQTWFSAQALIDYELIKTFQTPLQIRKVSNKVNSGSFDAPEAISHCD